MGRGIRPTVRIVFFGTYKHSRQPLTGLRPIASRSTVGNRRHTSPSAAAAPVRLDAFRRALGQSASTTQAGHRLWRVRWVFREAIAIAPSTSTGGHFGLSDSSNCIVRLNPYLTLRVAWLR